MRKLLICALALGGFAASAQAADLSVDSLKDPLPEKLSFGGVTVYGTVDVGYGYQDHGVPSSGSFYTGYNYVPNKYTAGQQSAIMNNAMSQSQVGVKVEESVGMGFVAVAKLDTGFNPISGELADACKSLVQAGTQPAGHVAANSDGGRCGQFLNGNAYGGLSHSTYGTLTVGRQNAFMNDGVGTYDPNHGSYAFSLIGFSGGAAAGIGATETSRWDNSVKYLYQFGPVHAGVMYANGGQDTAIFGNAVGGNVGATYKGLSIDGYYTKENGAVNAGTNSANNGTLKGTITDNEAYSVMAKYTMDLGGGGFKDEPGAKLSFFGGYMHADVDASNADQSTYANWNTIGGYQLGAMSGIYYTSTKTLQTEWAGAAYQTGPWTLTGAYYHQSQDYFGVALSGAAGASLKGTSGVNCSNTSGTNCAGDINMGSFVVDYTFNKHFDVYAGVSVAQAAGGLASQGDSGTQGASKGFVQDATTSVVTGLRLKF